MVIQMQLKKVAGFGAGLSAIGLVVLSGCGGGGSGGGGGAAAQAAPTVAVGSSISNSGSTGVFTSNGVSYALTPAPAAGAAGSAKLVTLPNTGTAVGAATVSSITSKPIQTSLTTTINGTNLDPVNDVGVAYSYLNSKVSLFKISTQQEVATYDTLTATTLSFSGGFAKVVGAVMNQSNKTLVLATGDGFEVVDYSNSAAPTKLREIPSLQMDPVAGVEINENFGFDPKLPLAGTNYSMILTGGRQGGVSTKPVLTLVDANTGKVYKPDTATGSLFVTSQYIDAMAADTNYHVAILADEGTGTTFVDLNKLTLNTAGTYSLPAAAVSRIATYSKMDNLAIESNTHMVMMGQGFGGSSAVVAQLKDPAVGLGFSKETTLTMPGGTDNTGAQVFWSGSGDPHGVAAYITDATHPTFKAATPLACWVNMSATKIAIINLGNVLNGKLASPTTYNPMTSNPQDVAYFALP